MSDRTNPYARQWAQFRASTTEHELTVLHDDGLYRHLYMGQPNTGMWSWNVITWPGYLTIVGDIGGGYTFVRLRDMLTFFDTSGYGDYYGDGSPYLQADYWAEKLTHACRDSARSYDKDLVIQHVREYVAESGYEYSSEIFERAAWNCETEHEAVGWLAETLGGDTWEWDIRSLDHHYLLACYAIATTVRAYRGERDE